MDLSMTSRVCGSSIITPQNIHGRATNRVKCIMLYGENPTYTCISARNSTYEIATCQVLSLFVEQRENFQLPHVASLCNILSLRYRLLKLTHSFKNAQSLLIVLFWQADYYLRDFEESWLVK